MDDITALLDREVQDIDPADAAYERTLARAKKRHRRKRIGAAALALVIAATGVMAAVIAFHSAPSRPTSSTIRVPDVTGLTVADAAKVLGELHLHVGSVEYAPAPFVPRGIVARQDPARGPIRAPTGSTVQLTVSNGLPDEHGGARDVARSVLIPLKQRGRYAWTSPPLPQGTLFGVRARLIGRATLARPGTDQGPRGRAPYSFERPSADPERVRITFRVRSVRGPAWFAILRVFSIPQPPVPCTERTAGQRADIRSIQLRIHHLQTGIVAAPRHREVLRLKARLETLRARIASLRAHMQEALAACHAGAG